MTTLKSPHFSFIRCVTRANSLRFKSRTINVIHPLFELLLDLAALHGPESSILNDDTHLTAIACVSLLSLVVIQENDLLR